jgi:valyl-tRNA synthetase
MYLELKNVIPESEKNNVIYALYKNILVVLHPFVPFITEYIYQDVYRDKKSIMLEAFPKQISSKNQDLKIVESFMNIVSAIRSIRIKHGIKNVKKISFYTNNKNIKLFSADLDLLNISILAKHDTKQKYIATVIGTFTIYILNDFEDENEQKINNEKILQQLQEEITRSENILSNKNFILKAPKEKVEIEKQKLVDYKNKYKELLAIKNKNN